MRKGVLEKNCSKYFLKVSISKFLVKYLKLQAEIWKPITLLNSNNSTTPGISQYKKDSGHTPLFLFCYHSFKYPKCLHIFTSKNLIFLEGWFLFLKGMKSLISCKSLDKVRMFLNGKKYINYFDCTPPLFFKVNSIFQNLLLLKRPLVTTLTETRALTSRKYSITKYEFSNVNNSKHQLLWSNSSIFDLE